MVITAGEIEPDGNSSDDELYDSDRIDSDVEAELYSVIHHQQNSSIISTDSANNSIIISDERNCLSNSNSKITQAYLNSQEIVNDVENFSVIEINSSVISNETIDSDLYITPKKKREEVKQESGKRKSDVISDILNNLQSTSKKQKKVKTNSDSNSSDVVFLSSDDDSDIIWTDPSKTNNSFQTNLSGIFDAQNLDSDSNDSWSQNLPNDTISNLSRSKNLEDPWHINHDDLYRYKKTSGRYHESSGPHCSNCNQKGHITRFCPVAEARKCFICGGQHKANNCRKRICVKCHKTGHQLRFCQRTVFTCMHCKMIGHHFQQCPDMWRKFQFTTTQKFVMPERLEQTTPLYCYNCGRGGHFGGECQENRMDIRMDTIFYPTWPFVLNYSMAKEKRKKPEIKIKHPATLPLEENYNSFMDNFLAKKESASKKKSPKLKKKKKVKSPKVKSRSEEQAQETNFPRTPKSKIPDEQRKNNSVDTYKFPQLPSTPNLTKKQKKKRRSLKNKSF